MSARYTLKIVTDFAAAHSLRQYPGDCANLHGHNWQVEAEVTATALNEVGMGMDFKQIRQATKAICERLDHTYLNELSPFDEINPTAENIAAYIYHQLAERLNGDSARVSAITIWETERACVRYTEE
ncbi:6-pyruvoyl tetrahydrobiopterin synthase [Candidatus Tenderia electrophaga]|jgi:6-pyruvoyltetrahydropterin/6-carboxytetrahydropterin synthase|uniref:6-carboxy-5,6,7,8-tetrahydropterin synthase n=1 Tax=Candidatus Tenderia electrophaga TaxID=1748243 RepID=A0A0S2T9K1_9GAMM|nr:6-pyruvoyl tetrahydrobiopterin synthase [Candidatus Tenderia electrophaga]